MFAALRRWAAAQQRRRFALRASLRQRFGKPFFNFASFFPAMY
jgi:hypothetical protein